MSNPKRSPFTFVLALSLLTAGGAFADQTINTGIPGGDGKDLLSNPKDPSDRPAGTIIVHDEECAKKTMKGEKLNNGQPNPEYEKCVKAKLEKAKKKSQPTAH